MIERHVQAIFCDDIRHEVNGKISYIGVYAGKLFTPKFPVILPKLCAEIKIISPVDKPLQSLNVTVYKDDDVLQEIPVSDEDLKKASQPIDDYSDDELIDHAQVIALQLIFSPLQLDSPCMLKVKAKTEQGEMRGLGLKIEEFPTN